MNKDGTPPVLRILMIEHNKEDAEALTKALNSVTAYQFDVLQVAEITEAIKKVSGALFDIIFLDLTMPEMTSVQALDELVSHTPGVSIVAIVAPGDEELAERALTRGAQDYLVKEEWSKPLLERVVRYCLNRRQSEEQIAKLAHYDALTGVANRYLFNDRLSQAVFRSERSGLHVAILFLDLDHFHGVNETLGYEMGDVLLKEAAMRIVRCVRRQDTIARIGGDEFAVVLEGINEAQDVSTIAKQILEAFQEPVYLDNHPIFISLSIGISLSDDHHRDEKTLIKQADIARYRAKEHGRNNFQFFSLALNEAAQQRMDLEKELNQALNRIFHPKKN